MPQPNADSAANVSDPALWLQEHGDALFRFAMSRVGHADVAEDLVQETLLAAIEKRDSFQSRAQLRSWLVAILKRKIVDHHRRESRGRPATRPSATDAGLEAWVEGQFDAKGKWQVAPVRWDRASDDAATRTELRSALAECLKGLTPRAAQALLLTERQELPAERVGKILGLTPTNVGVILYRARTALRKCLEERWIGRTIRDDDAVV